MAWTVDKRFPLWGRDGADPTTTSPPTNAYADGDQIADVHFNYLWDSLWGLERDVRNALADIDSDEDGRVDAADSTQLVDGFDIDTDGDGEVNATRNAELTYKSTDLDTGFASDASNSVVSDSDFELVYMDSIADGTALRVSEAALTAADGSGAPSGTQLNLVTVSGGSTTLQTTLLDGGGIRFTDTAQSYTNTSGGEQMVAVILDNGTHSTGTGSDTKLFGAVNARIT